MFILLVLHPTLRIFHDYVSSLQNSSSSYNAKINTGGILRTRQARADARLDRRITFDVVFGILYLVALHGVSAAKALVILYLNFMLATRLPRKYVPAATWVFNIGVLFGNEFGKGYPLALVAEYFLPLLASTDTASEKATQVTWRTTVDNYGGLIPRWEILFKFAILRVISFNFDYCWSSNRAGDNPLEVGLLQKHSPFFSTSN